MTETTQHIRWHGQDFVATTETIKIGAIETCVEVPNLPDAGLRHIIAVATAAERIEGAVKLAPVHEIELALARWVDEGGTNETWSKLEISLGITKSRTRPAKGRLQPFFRWLHGGKPDTNSYYDDLAAVADWWLSLPKNERPDPHPENGGPGTSDFAKKLVWEGGYVAVAKAFSNPEENELRLFGWRLDPRRKSPLTNPYDSDAGWWSVYQWRRADDGAFDWVRISDRFDTIDDAEAELAKQQAEMEAEAVGEPDYTGLSRGAEEEDYSESDLEITRGDKPPKIGEWRAATGGKRDYYSKTEHQTDATNVPSEHPQDRSDADLLSENARLKTRVTELENELSALKGQKRGPEIKKQFWRTPPPMYAVLDRLFHFDFDACPHNRLPDFNSLEVAWKQSNYVNSPFSARHNPEGIGPTDFVRKSIEENRLGKNSVIVLPTFNYVNMLLGAGAEPFAIGPVPWIEADTGEPIANRPNITGFVLWGSQFTEAEKAIIMARLKTEIPKLGYRTTAPDNVVPLRRHGT
jgi:hypothetical protein